MRQVPILVYHWFRPAGRQSDSCAPRFEITPPLFARQMRMLEQHGFQAVTLSTALDAAKRRELPARHIAITFDDGTADFWEHARPILKEHGFVATLFVVTGQVGGHNQWDHHLGEPRRSLLSWDQLRALQAEGHEIGSHTHTHPRLPGLSDEAVRQELAGSLETLRSELGAAPRQLAYPYGAFLPHHRQLAREVGYASASATILGWRDLMGADRFGLRRMPIKGTESMLRFRLRLQLAGAVLLRTPPP